MDIHHLVSMVNQIGEFWDTEYGSDKAPPAIASHIARFWEPRMRREIILYAQAGGPGLSPSAQAAVLTLPLPAARR
ncbi:MAG: formate dehydrogenase subunit delta [Gammaproteobacteria bacterium]|jgi:formate dehydrogenase subunit delta|nr:formate dehydrogenase subunit delta [Gammaproteobacteria bacterium]